MDKNTTAFFNLIRKSQFDDIDLPDPSSVDWNYIYEEAKAQAVLGIIAPLVPEEIVQKDIRWREAIDRQTASYIQYLFAEEELVKLLDAKQIPYVILKGNAVAVNYRHPERRQMGDIDFLIPLEYFQDAKTLLLSNNYYLNPKSESNLRHIKFQKNGIEFEMHRKYSHPDIDLEQYVLEGIENRTNKSIWTHSFETLPALSNGIVLLDHMRSHLKVSLGLRQIVDWMMFANKYLDDEYWKNEFQKSSQEIKMDKFAITVTRMCQIYLGLPDTITWCNTADEELCKRLIKNILSSGNMGSKKSAGIMIESATTHFRRKGVFRYMQFVGERDWPAYKKHHWLRPFAWIYQLTRYIKHGLKTKRSIKQLMNDNKQGHIRSNLLKDLGI